MKEIIKFLTCWPFSVTSPKLPHCPCQSTSWLAVHYLWCNCVFRLRCVKFRPDNLSGDVDALSITAVTLLNTRKKEERKKKNEVKKLIAWPLSTLWRRHRPACTLPRYIRIINVDRCGSPYSLPWCGRMCQVGEWQLSRKVTQGKFISQWVNATAKGGKKVARQGKSMAIHKQSQDVNQKQYWLPLFGYQCLCTAHWFCF